MMYLYSIAIKNLLRLIGSVSLYVRRGTSGGGGWVSKLEVILNLFCVRSPHFRLLVDNRTVR